jgi:hypothetical protein
MLPTFLNNPSSWGFWGAWSFALVWQNYSFTRVSRARNSASLKAHAIASLQSNSAWFLQSLFVYSAFMNILTGHAGVIKAIGAGLFYTALTMSGSVYAHYVSLKKEKGKTAVGANNKYAQVPVEEWEYFKRVLEQAKRDGLPGEALPLPLYWGGSEFQRVAGLAEQAYACAVDSLPVAATAGKFDGATITTQS